MDRVAHLSLNAMRLNGDNQRAITASLANQNTIAFKRDLYSNLASAYISGGNVNDRAYSTRGDASVSIEQGKLIPTGNPLDLSLEGRGFMVGQKPNGEQVVTRRGDLNIGPDRILRNGEGVAVIGDAGAITVPPYRSIELSRDGTVSIHIAGAEEGQPATPIGRIRLVDIPANNITKGEDSLMRPKNGIFPQADAAITIIPEALESSNIDPIQAMVDMLSNTRSYEMSVKILTTAKDLDAETAKLMRSDR